MIYDRREVSISLREPEKGPEKVKNGRFGILGFFGRAEKITLAFQTRPGPGTKISEFYLF